MRDDPRADRGRIAGAVGVLAQATRDLARLGLDVVAAVAAGLGDRPAQVDEAREPAARPAREVRPVSYTHLTLPTIHSLYCRVIPPLPQLYTCRD